jgi:hypothetical protein
MFQTFRLLMHDFYGLSCSVFISSESEFPVSKVPYVIMSEFGKDYD